LEEEEEADDEKQACGYGDCLALFLSFMPITSDAESKLAVKGGQ